MFLLNSLVAQKLMIKYSYKLYDAFTPKIDLLDKAKGQPCVDECGRTCQDGESGQCSDQCNKYWCENGEPCERC